MDLAASVQKVTEDIVIELAKGIAKKQTNEICMAGGVALNCVAKGILREKFLIIFGFSQPLVILVVH